MHARSTLGIALASLAAACASHPNSDHASMREMQTKGYGGWIIVEARTGQRVEGELISVDHGRIYVLSENRKLFVEQDQVEQAELYAYPHEGGFGVWAGLGTLSTISHGFLLILSSPVWLIAGGLVANNESRHMIHYYPGESLDAFNKWARYPQGMPRTTVIGPPGGSAPASPERTARDQAWILVKEAMASARSGACDVVALLDVKIKTLDADLHAATFLRDEAIRRCLGLPSLLVPPAQTPVGP